jgi:hypothetical protein
MKRPALIVAIAIFLITHAANLQIPLYSTYAKLAGFGSGISAIAGTACYGFTYLGGLAEVVGLGGNQSARVTSGYFACAYLGYGIPVIFIGFLSDLFGTIHTLVGFGGILLFSNALLIIVYRTLQQEKKFQP